MPLPTSPRVLHQPALDPRLTPYPFGLQDTRCHRRVKARELAPHVEAVTCRDCLAGEDVRRRPPLQKASGW